ncbi:MAG TPA: Cof-type HAD-IIB family hydrolase [Candidatus Olsenella stercoravium]|uniref:Cof-type HAD-IIB family hydrolase n=1 Tax=Candidatus Olsenella stercoravium TaxID=2838713 RepID=A0A9D2DL32_9ACTN|nr:Cof-type HAD-IIB family hydrolase [Candidatus Olsenella stercoravium]
MIKLFASDLDGTLFNILHETDGAILRRLRRTLDAGRHVALATGRCVRRSADMGFGDLPVESIGANGAHIVGRDGEVLRHVAVDPAALEELLAAFPQVCFICVGRDRSYVRGTFEQRTASYVGATGPIGALLRWRFRRGGLGEEELLDQTDAEVLAQDICKVNFRVSDPGLRRELETFVAEHADALVNASFDGVLFELTDARVNKGEAVAWLACELGISEDEVAVYGDGGNDLAMLERFSHSYATSNASDDAKRAAGNVIGSCALHAVPRHMLVTVRREGPLT